MNVYELPTPALVVDADALAHNLAAMAVALPGSRARPHVKAHKCTELARRQAEHGHRTFCAATPREIVGLARAGLGDDLLLANETIDLERLAAMAALDARVTIAVDSEPTIDAAARAGIREVLVDVDVGMPRCGCQNSDAGRLADLARARGLHVRGVMGYEGHVVGNPERTWRAKECEASMRLLLDAHALVGGEVVSGGGTGTYDLNTWCTELQVGSYALMDTAYAQLRLPFRPALRLETTVLSVHPDGWAACDGGLKSLGMDHGNPAMDTGEVLFCSDEHITFFPNRPVSVGSRVDVWPAHVDPTVAYHEVLHVTDAEGTVIDTWPVDLRGW